LRLAAEDYGDAREALNALNRECSLAVTERTRAAGDPQRYVELIEAPSANLLMAELG
jgi:Cdc6-like AAA superfamily ATPase